MSQDSSCTCIEHLQFIDDDDDSVVTPKDIN